MGFEGFRHSVGTRLWQRIRPAARLHFYLDLCRRLKQGFGFLEPTGEVKRIEIAAIATNPVYGHLSMGRKIVSYLIEKAAKIGMTRVFVLTTRTIDWFEQLGFVEADVASLPARKRDTYNQARKSRIFTLELKDRKSIKS